LLNLSGEDWWQHHEWPQHAAGTNGPAVLQLSPHIGPHMTSLALLGATGNPGRHVAGRALSRGPLLAMKIPETIIPYADAASLMLDNVDPRGPMSCRRVGIAPPVGLRGRKHEWAAPPRGAG
jgi:hypothetical protein